MKKNLKKTWSHLSSTLRHTLTHPQLEFHLPRSPYSRNRYSLSPKHHSSQSRRIWKFSVLDLISFITKMMIFNTRFSRSCTNTSKTCHQAVQQKLSKNLLLRGLNRPLTVQRNLSCRSHHHKKQLLTRPSAKMLCFNHPKQRNPLKDAKSQPSRGQEVHQLFS